jgi:hypothetical protein
MRAGRPEEVAVVTHTCPVCRRTHQVRDARAAVAYGRQFTCSPECESERRRRRRHAPARPLVVDKRKRGASGWQRLRVYAARSLHVWVIAATGADLVRTASWTRSSDPFR